MQKDPEIILNARQIKQKIYRMAHHIYENHFKAEKLFLVGISEKGVPFSNQLAEVLREISGLEVSVHVIKLNKENPLQDEVIFDGELKAMKNQVVIIVDDVLNSGKTMMHAMSYLLKAQPRNMATAVLIERMYRRFPIRADYVGLSLSTNLKEHVTVDFTKGKEVAELN